MIEIAAQSRSGGSLDSTNEDDPPRVGIVVLHWNRIDETRRCIQSLSRLRYKHFHVFVVDNGSDIPLDGLLSEDFRNLSIIRSSENLGFAGGCNVGIRESAEDGCDFVWLLNNDAIVDPDALRHLIEVAEEQPVCGVVGSAILEYDDRQVINHIGGQLNPYKGLTIHLGKGESYPSSADKKNSPLSFVTGCSMLARMRMIRDVGLMDEGYFLYWEDVDWCVRARRKGWDIAVANESLVYHRSSSSVGYGSPLKSYYVARNSIRFVWKRYPWLLPFSIAWWPRQHLLNHILRGRFQHARLSFRAPLDALLGWVLVPQGVQANISVLKKKVNCSESFL